jgi:hypothetical protein
MSEMRWAGSGMLCFVQISEMVKSIKEIPLRDCCTVNGLCFKSSSW